MLEEKAGHDYTHPIPNMSRKRSEGSENNFLHSCILRPMQARKKSNWLVDCTKIMLFLSFVVYSVFTFFQSKLFFAGSLSLGGNNKILIKFLKFCLLNFRRSFNKWATSEKSCFCHMHSTKIQVSLRSLISAFVVLFLDSTIPILAKSIFNSPEPKAHWWAYRIGRPLSSVRMCVCVCVCVVNIFKHLLLWNH